MNGSNGDTINQKLPATNGIVLRQLAATNSPAGIIEQACLSALSPLPTAAERRTAPDDVYWALLSGRWFLFNH